MADELPAESSANRFPCPACGAAMRFLPGTHQMICDHCDHRQDIDPAKRPLRELSYEAALADLDRPPSLPAARTVVCTGCAATFTVDPAIESERCPYCGSNVVLAATPM